jgi:transglutaminase-like putative cysteine protease
MEPRLQRLSLDELHLVRWLLGGILMLLSIATVFYMDISSEWLAAIAAGGVLVAMARPALPARVPIWAHRLAFPAILAFFAGDLWRSGQLLPAIVRLDLLLLLYRGISHRARRDDLQIVVLGLFLIIVAGVLTVSLIFAGQILMFTACALGLLMVVTIAASTEGGQAPKLAVRGVVPSWAGYGWGRLFARLWSVADWRLLASAAALFLGVVAVSGLLFLAIPRFQLENSLFLERFVVRHAMTGFNDSIKFGDVSDITLDDGIAFDADLSDPSQAPANPYWRMVVLDEYKDGGFKLSPTLRAAFDRERTSANVLSGYGASWGSPTWTFYVESGVSRYLPVLGRFGALRFRDAQNYRYSPDLGIVALRDEPASMTAYRVDGMNPGSDEMKDLAFAGRWKKRGPVGLPLQVGLDSLSPSDRAALVRLDAQVGLVKGTPTRDFARRAIAWLRKSHQYSLAPRIPSGPGDPLVRWVASGEPGHCELFAGSLVAMARTAGIPARVVTGFRGGTWNGYSGNYTIRNSDAHAWTELWDPLAGAWVREDPLGDAVAIDPLKERGDAALATMMDRSWSARLNSLRVFWYRRIVNFDQQTQVDTARAVRSAADTSGKWLRTVLSGIARDIKGWMGRPWDVSRFLRIGTAAAGASFLLWALAKGRWRLGGGKGKFDPVRREAGRWLRKVDGPEPLVCDLQRLRFGPAPSWPRPAEVFSRARRAAASSRRRRRASSRSTS